MYYVGIEPFVYLIRLIFNGTTLKLESTHQPFAANRRCLRYWTNFAQVCNRKKNARLSITQVLPSTLFLMKVLNTDFSQCCRNTIIRVGRTRHLLHSYTLIDLAQILYLKFQDRTKSRRESENIFLGGPIIITPKIITHNTVKFKLNMELFIYFKIN